MAAAQTMTAALTGRDHVVLGTTASGRPTSATDAVIGQFTHNVYLPAHVGPSRPSSTPADIVAEVDKGLKEAMDNALPWTDLARAVNDTFDDDRPWADNHLFDLFFQAEAPPAADLHLPELRIEPAFVEPQPAPGTRPVLAAGDVPAELLPRWARRGSPYLVIDEDRGGGRVIYNEHFFEPALVERIVVAYQAAVSALTASAHQPLGRTP
jgi:non-ribosomal peptide synthetase component F